MGKVIESMRGPYTSEGYLYPQVKCHEDMISTHQSMYPCDNMGGGERRGKDKPS
jgi:hypothetical protein